MVAKNSSDVLPAGWSVESKQKNGRKVEICSHAGEGKVFHFTRGTGQEIEIGTGTVLDRFIFSSSPSHPEGSPCPSCGDQSRLDGVISSCMECFLSGGDLYRSSPSRLAWSVGSVEA